MVLFAVVAIVMTAVMILATPASSLVQIILCGIYFLWMHRRQKFTKI